MKKIILIAVCLSFFSSIAALANGQKGETAKSTYKHEYTYE